MCQCCLLSSLAPSRDVLEKRVRERQIDFIPPPIKEAMAGAASNILEQLGEELAAATPWLYERVYANISCYDLLLDTSTLRPEEVCERIEQRLKQGRRLGFETRLKTLSADLTASFEERAITRRSIPCLIHFWIFRKLCCGSCAAASSASTRP